MPDKELLLDEFISHKLRHLVYVPAYLFHMFCFPASQKAKPKAAELAPQSTDPTPHDVKNTELKSRGVSIEFFISFDITADLWLNIY